MGLFGGMSEDELRVSGTAATARVVYSDDTGKRRDDGARAKVKLQLKIDGGSARGRDLEQTKWVPADRIPRVGETVQIRFDPDDVDDWAWGDGAMYAPVRPVARPAHAPAAGAQPVPGQAVVPGQVVPGQTFDWMEYAANAMSAWGSSGIDANQLNQMIQTAMQQGGMSVQHIEVGADGVPRAVTSGPQDARRGPSGSAGDTAARLRQVDELHQQGLIDADEHKRLRQRIIESI